MASELTIAAAFAAGLLSFFSPCVLPILPGFLAYIGSIGARAGFSGAPGRKWIFLNSAAYVAGFALVFSLAGALLNNALFGMGLDARLWLAKISGLLIMGFGLNLLGILRLDFLATERKIRPGLLDSPLASSFLLGVGFALGWSPCMGPLLGSALVLAAADPGASFALLLSYSAGLGLPFLLSGAFATQAGIAVAKLGPYLKYVNAISGALLLLLGFLVFTGELTRLSESGLAWCAK